MIILIKLISINRSCFMTINGDYSEFTALSPRLEKTKPIIQKKSSQTEIFQKLKTQAKTNKDGATLVCKSIQQVETEDKRYKIGKIAADQGVLSPFVVNYKITDQNLRFELAKKAVMTDVVGVSENIDKYELNQTQRFEIAKLAAILKASTVLDNLEKYDLDSYQILEFLKLAIPADNEIVGMVSGNIHLYQFDQQQSFQIVKLIAVIDPGVFSGNINAYNLNQKQRFKIAKLIAKDHEGLILNILKKLKLTQEQAFEVIKIAAYKGDREFVSDLEQHELSKDQLFQIVKILAAHKASAAISENIDDYEFHRDQRLQIAKLAAAKNGRAVCENIQKYKLNQKHRFKVAKKAMASNKCPALTSLKKFKLTDLQLFDVLKIAATNPGASSISFFIKQCNFTQDQYFELAKIVAMNNGSDVSKYIQNYNLDKVQRFEVAKLAASNGGASYYIHKYEFDSPAWFRQIVELELYGLDQNQRFEIAKTVAPEIGVSFSQVIDLFELNENQRFEIAKQIAIKVKQKILENLDKYELTQYESFEIIKITAKNNDGKDVLDCLKIYQIVEKYHLDKDQLFQVFLIIASNDSRAISKIIEEYNLNQNQRFQLVRIAAVNNGEHLLSDLNTFNLNRDQLFQALKIIASYNGEVCENIDAYKFDQSRRFKIAKISAAYDGKAVLENIAKFQLDQHQIFRILQIIAGKDKSTVFMNLNNHKLEQDQFFQILTLVADECYEKISIDIDTYKLNQNQRLQIAKITATAAAAQEKTEFFLENINNYKLTQDQFFEVLQILAAKDGKTVTEKIQSFNFNQNQRFALAKIAAGQNGENVVKNIGNYQLDQNEGHFFEVAKMAMTTKAAFIPKELIELKLTPEQLFEVIKICAMHNGGSYIPYFINLFGFTQDQRFELVKLAAVKWGESISENIDQYAFNLHQRFEVAKIVAQNEGVSKNIHKYKINRQDLLRQLAELEILSSESSKAEKIIKRFSSTLDAKLCYRMLLQANLLFSGSVSTSGYASKENRNWADLMQKIDQISQEELSDKTLLQETQGKLIALQEKVKTEIINTWGENSVVANQLIVWLQTAAKHENLLIKQKQLSWVTNICAICQARNTSEDEIAFLLPILKSLSELPDSTLRAKMTYRLIHDYLGEEKAVLREQYMQVAKIHPDDNGLILAMLFVPLTVVPEENFAEDFLKRFYANKISQAGKSQRIIMELLFYLESKGINAKEQVTILKQIIVDLPLERTISMPRGLAKKERQNTRRAQQEELKQQNVAFTQMLNCAQITIDLLLLGKTEKLKTITTKQEIVALMEEVYQEVLGDTKVDNFSEKYTDSFATFRNKQALWTYYAKLLTLSSNLKKETLPYFKLFVQSVLEGTFHETRYQKTEHLKTIFDARSDLKEAWTKDEIASSEELLEDIEIQKTKEPLSLATILTKFKTKILVNKHLGQDVEEKYPELILFLNHPQNRELNLKSIEEKRKQELKKPKSAEKKSNLGRLAFEKCLLDIFASETNCQKRLEEARRIAPPTSDFKHDLEGMIRLSTSPKKSSGNLQIMITDHPSEFILIGEEVQESCQRVNGNPVQNRGLLGYAFNGQVKVIKVTEEKDNQQVADTNKSKVARAILRLLWDKNTPTPILYLEPIYMAKDNPIAAELIINLAKRYANQHKLPLLTKMVDLPGKQYPNAVYSLESLCPFEYVDALEEGEASSSTYTVKNCIQIA